MKKNTKLIVILMVTAILVSLAALAVADDKIYTSDPYKLPKNRIEVPEEPEEPEEPGDINGDGEANNKDVVILFRYVSGDKKLDDESAYDFNGDNEVNIKDTVRLFKYLSGFDVEIYSKEPDENSGGDIGPVINF